MSSASVDRLVMKRHRKRMRRDYGRLARRAAVPEPVVEIAAVPARPSWFARVWRWICGLFGR